MEYLNYFYTNQTDSDKLLEEVENVEDQLLKKIYEKQIELLGGSLHKITLTKRFQQLKQDGWRSLDAVKLVKRETGLGLREIHEVYKQVWHG